ncbi:hypothetical protein C2W62_00900 [Candidatus Entotheonella serta]|nr:hypothetical protein C2W62_00900 [Candidatus Entotheonella serta]
MWTIKTAPRGIIHLFIQVSLVVAWRCSAPSRQIGLTAQKMPSHEQQTKLALDAMRDMVLPNKVVQVGEVDRPLQK